MNDALLPSGHPVNALRSGMLDPAHAPEVVAERITWQRDRFRLGMVVRRDDGCLVRLTAFENPTVGGYIFAYGDHIDRMTRQPSGGMNYHTGPLTQCEIVNL